MKRIDELRGLFWRSNAGGQASSEAASLDQGWPRPPLQCHEVSFSARRGLYLHPRRSLRSMHTDRLLTDRRAHMLSPFAAAVKLAGLVWGRFASQACSPPPAHCRLAKTERSGAVASSFSLCVAGSVSVQSANPMAGIQYSSAAEASRGSQPILPRSCECRFVSRRSVSTRSAAADCDF